MGEGFGSIPRLGQESPASAGAKRQKTSHSEDKQFEGSTLLEKAVEMLLDPISGSTSKGRKVEGIILTHVDDLLMFGTKEFREKLLKYIQA